LQAYWPPVLMEDANEKHKRLIFAADKLIDNGKYLYALDELLKCRPALARQSNKHAYLVVLNNCALCYQKSGQLRESLEAIALAVRVLEGDQVSEAFAERMKAMREISRYKLQACALMSQLNMRREAYDCAKDVLEECRKLVRSTILLCVSEINSQYSNRRSSKTLKKPLEVRAYSDRAAPSNIPALQKALEIVKYLDHFNANKETSKPPDLGFRSVLGLPRLNHWIFKLTIGGFMTVEKKSLADPPASPERELSIDSMIAVCCTFIMAYYCYATEVRLKYVLLNDLSCFYESEAVHKRSVELASSLLPMDCPLVEHLKLTFGRNFPESSERQRPSSSTTIRSERRQYKPKLKASTEPQSPPPKTAKLKSRSLTPIKERSITRRSKLSQITLATTRLLPSPYANSSSGRKIALKSKCLFNKERLAYLSPV